MAAQARSEASVEIDLVEIVELAGDEDALLNTDHSREVLRLKKEHARRPTDHMVEVRPPLQLDVVFDHPALPQKRWFTSEP